MSKVLAVTGYVPLPILNVSESKYRELGSQLLAACPDHVAFDYDPLDKCWAHRFVKSMMPHHASPSLPADRFPDEWTALSSSIVNLNKTWWLCRAQKMEPHYDFYVWIDYGILKQTGMTPGVISDFLAAVATKGTKDAIVAPGLVDKGEPMSWSAHHTRFCGSVLIVPAELTVLFHADVVSTVYAHVHGTHTLSYDVNYFAAVERNGVVPFRQYRAWWDATQFTNYAG